MKIIRVFIDREYLFYKQSTLIIPNFPIPTIIGQDCKTYDTNAS